MIAKGNCYSPKYTMSLLSAPLKHIKMIANEHKVDVWDYFKELSRVFPRDILIVEDIIDDRVILCKIQHRNSNKAFRYLTVDCFIEQHFKLDTVKTLWAKHDRMTKDN
jgi:hypothetical protein